MIDWAQLIKERDEWVARNFPPIPGEVPGNDSVLGCIEELGELTHGFLKLKQGIRGTPEEHNAAMRDAVGDLIIYLLGVMSAHGGKMRGKYSLAITPEECLFLLSTDIGVLSYYNLRMMGKSPALQHHWEGTIGNIVANAKRFCELQVWDFEEIVTTTWDHVKQRDWQKHRAEGAASDDPAVRDPESSPLSSHFGPGRTSKQIYDS